MGVGVEIGRAHLFVKNVYFKDLTMQIEFNWNSIEQENGERLLKSALKYRGKGKRFDFFIERRRIIMENL